MKTIERRWFLVLAALVAGLASAACSGETDRTTDGSGLGGSAGSSPGSAGSPPAAVGLDLIVHPPSSPIPGSICPVSASSLIGNPPPNSNPPNPGGRVSDGVSGVSVDCSVKGPSTFSVSAQIALDALHFEVVAGTIGAVSGTGTFGLAMSSAETGALASEADQPCTVDVSEPPLEVTAGNLFAGFECPALWNRENPTPTACGAEGVIVLEFCKQ